MESPQVVFVNGGMTFSNRDDYLDFLKDREVSVEKKETWDTGNYLEEALEHDLVRVDMPCWRNADYEEWKITFENYLPLLSEKVILVGLSLGGTFLAKYLSENKFPKEILSAYLIGAPYDDDLKGETLAGGFKISSNLSLLEDNCNNLTLMYSEEDDIVPLRHSGKFKERLSDPETITYENKNGHFQVAEFPELIEKIGEDE